MFGILELNTGSKANLCPGTNPQCETVTAEHVYKSPNSPEIDKGEQYQNLSNRPEMGHPGLKSTFSINQHKSSIKNSKAVSRGDLIPKAHKS